MKHLGKKIMAGFLCLCMALSMIGVIASADETEGTVVVVNNDNDIKVTDASYDQYFEGTAEEGVAALLAAGKCYINGIALPANETDTDVYNINMVKSLWKTENGWCYNVHKYTGDDNMTFEDARKQLFDMTSTVRGHQTRFYLDDQGICQAINIDSYEVVKVDSIENQGHDTVIRRPEFELETQRVRVDINDRSKVLFPTANVDLSIKAGDIAVYYFGSEELDGIPQWHAVRATPVVGKVTKDPASGVSIYIVNEGTSDEFRKVESNVSRYNLIDSSRPTQGYSIYTRLQLTDRDIVLWNTPNGYPIGFTYGLTRDESRANLKAGIENAEKLVEEVQVSEDGEGVADGTLWAPQAAVDEFNEAIASAKAVANKNSASSADIEWAMWELRNAWGEGGDKPSGFMGEVGGQKEETPDTPDTPSAPEPEEDIPGVWNNDGETKVTDPEFDKYFEGTAEEGVAKLLNEGKCSINGLPIPKTEDETAEYQINAVKSLWKTENGWCYNVHKYTGDDNMTFEDARKQLFDMTSTVRGHHTTFTLDENGYATAIDIESFEVSKLVYFEDHGGNVDKLDRGDFELETQRVRYDLNKITAIESKNFDPNIRMGDVVVYWNGADGWHMIKAAAHVGVLTSPEHSVYCVDGDWTHIESNVSRYNLIDDTRPTQGYNAYTRLGLQEAGIPIITWVTPNDFPIGFSYGSNAKAALTKAIENAEALAASVVAAEDGSKVPSDKQWATQEAIDTFREAIEAAKAVNNKNSSASWDREKAIYALAQAWGEGGDRPSGFAGELGEGEADPQGEPEPSAGAFAIDIPVNGAVKLSGGVSYESSDPAVATVTAKGLVKAVKYGRATITATAADGSKSSFDVQTRYYDVTDDSSYYFAPVYWAAENGITRGYDGEYFGPKRDCQRREMVIFLWRMAGKPESAANPQERFSDMSAYSASTDTYKAVAWAVETGIVNGYSDGTFRPAASVTRKDTLIMLYRLAGKPQVSGSVAYSDIRGYGALTDTFKAIMWAANNGITKGYADGTFRPDDNCLREHIVTFLYRYNSIK